MRERRRPVPASVRAAGMRLLAAGLLAWLWLSSAAAQVPAGDTDTIEARDRQLIDARLREMPAQRPGLPDLYALGFAGDGDENVFRNEVAYFEALATARYGADGRTLALINHPDSLEQAPRPLATLDNLRHALAGIARAMDPDEDLLLLYLTTHGSRQHELSIRLGDRFDVALKPAQLRAALDDAGIRHRLLIVSACFSGGFIPALATPDTLVIAAARRDRPSFGCGDSASATYFGRALLVEGLNRDGGLVEAFEYAKRQVARRETMEGHTPSEPQLWIGEDIRPRLQAWEDSLVRGPALAYPHPL